MYACARLVAHIMLATTHITHLVWKSYFRLQGLLQQTCVLMQNKGEKRSIKTVRTSATHRIKMHACARSIIYIILLTENVADLVWKACFLRTGAKLPRTHGMTDQLNLKRHSTKVFLLATGFFFKTNSGQAAILYVERLEARVSWTAGPPCSGRIQLRAFQKARSVSLLWYVGGLDYYFFF